ncbi:PIN-like domain-containing protein [Pseudonocardia sp. CA-107938]|uniref:PIN-like domain-containing protein n=1 Tax=Pseudonocardia sp. CA-107938 TaxID=3240021 RepID=UPI003D8EDBDE
MAHLRGMYEDFAGHRVPDDLEVASALRSAMVVVDTNVLLDLYRFSDATREAMLKVLSRLGGRLFVPHQVMREFWRNRLDVVSGRGRAAEETLERIDLHLGATATTVRAWATPAGVAGPVRDELLGRIAAVQQDLRDAVTEQRPVPVDPRGVADPVLDRLERLLAGRVGPAQDAAEWADAIATGQDRIERRVPPGYLDAEKSGTPEGGTGDYLMWSQSIAEVARRGTDGLVLVTGDGKPDWWVRRGPVFVGPRPELSDELWTECGAGLTLLRPVDLLRHAGELGVPVTDASIAEAGRVWARSPWTADGIALLLARCAAEGLPHADVIRAAVAQGGFVEHAVPDPAAYVRPVDRITTDLQVAGLVAADVAPALTPARAAAPGFRVAYEFTAPAGAR